MLQDDSITSPGYDPANPAASPQYENFIFCELDVRGFSKPIVGQRFFQVPTLPAGTYDVRAYLTVNNSNATD
eukprot:SAG31_NODE_32252_length_358_cov_0.598456_1_plen_71_part_10